MKAWLFNIPHMWGSAIRPVVLKKIYLNVGYNDKIFQYGLQILKSVFKTG